MTPFHLIVRDRLNETASATIAATKPGTPLRLFCEFEHRFSDMQIVALIDLHQ
jgi:hypothetical protein